MNPQQWDSLLSEYLDGAHAPEAPWGEIDEAQAAELLNLVELDGLLRHRFREKDSEAFGRGVRQRIDAERTGTSFARRVEQCLSPRRRPVWPVLTAAAALVLGVGLYFLWPSGETQQPVARLQDVKGRVEVTGEEGRFAGSSNTPLFSGQGVETPSADGEATLLYPDGTRLKLGPRTVLRGISDNGSGKRVTVAKGSVAAQVNPQPSGRPMAFTTPHGEAIVLGTTLRLVVEPNGKGSTRLEVEEGKVRLRSSLETKSVDVQSGHYAVAAVGVDLVARPMESARPSRSAELLRRMAPNSWLSVPGTDLRKVVPDPAKYPKIQGISGAAGVIESWSGGAFDTRRNRLLVWGGGSTNYRGNELYAFRVEDLTWERLTDPSPDPADGADPNPDGTPNSRDTYNGLAYIAHADRFFASGGALNSTSGEGRASITWTFNFASNTWTNMNPGGNRPPTHFGNCCAYDPATSKVWWGEVSWEPSPAHGLYSYDYTTNLWTKHTSEAEVWYGHTMCVDTKRGILVWVGPHQTSGAGEVLSCDIRSGTPTVQKWTTTGGEAFISQSSPGLDYDPVADKIVGWHGGAVYILDPESKTWSPRNPPGAPRPTRTGIFGRWRYVPSHEVFILVTGIDDPVHFYKPGR